MICPEIYLPTPAHIMAHGCCKDTQDGSQHSNRKPWPSGKREGNCKHTDLSVLSSHHPAFSVSERDGTERVGDREPAWSPRLPVCGRKAAVCPWPFFLWPSVPGGPPGGWLEVYSIPSTSMFLTMLYVSSAKLGQSPDPVIRGKMAEMWNAQVTGTCICRGSSEGTTRYVHLGRQPAFTQYVTLGSVPILGWKGRYPSTIWTDESMFRTCSPHVQRPVVSS